MSYVRVLVFVMVLSVASLASAQKLEDWLPVTPQDWQIKDAPGNPGAAAIQLYYSYYKDDNAKFFSVYRRIKILREPARRQYGDVQIEIEPENSLKQLAARTIHPDGSITEFTGKPFDKTIIKGLGIKYTAKTFTMPDVTVGSIVEYKYVIGMPYGWVKTISSWEIQGELYTVKANFRFRPYQGVVEVPTEWSWTSNIRHSQVAYAYLNQLDARVPDRKKGNLVEFEAESIPAFHAEAYMPPEDDFKPTVLFYYGGHEIGSPERYWAEIGKESAAFTEKFIGSFREVRDLAEKVIGNETDPEKRLRKLYARAQQIRNISFERERTEEELKKEKLERTATVMEVLNRGYGTTYGINCLFAALARAAGFEANVLFVSDRRQRSFSKLVLSAEQIDSSAVMVKMNGQDLMLAPGTKYAPFGLLQWTHSSVVALKCSKSGADFVTTSEPKNSSTRRTGRMSLTADGTLKGEITVEVNGEDALERRLSALKTDEAGRRKDFEDEVRAWLPDGATVKLKDSQGWDATEEPLIARFEVEAPNFASGAGKRLIASAFLFPTFKKDMFVHEGRVYPIVFPYPFVENDEVDIKLPEGYSLEAPPYRRKAGLAYAGYEISSELQDNRLITKRSLHIDGLTFPPEKYDELKNFFGVVQAGDGGQAVLKPQEAATKDQ